MERFRNVSTEDGRRGKNTTWCTGKSVYTGRDSRGALGTGNNGVLEVYFIKE